MKQGIDCRICGAKANLIHRGTRDREDVNVFECERCHTKQLDIFGDNDYRDGFMNGGNMTRDEILNRLNECELDDFRRADFVRSLILEKKILDFGCGFGGFLSRVKEYACEICGVELGRDEQEYLEENGIPVKSSLEEVEGEFDVLTAFHVFEHLDNPEKWIEKFSQVVKSGGKIIMEVPNGDDALLKIYESKAFADFTYWSAHLFLYTAKSINLLLSRFKNLKVEKIEQIQRYPIANHLYWLAKNSPGGQNKWDIFRDKSLEAAYTEVLKNNNCCDTLMIIITKLE